MKKTPPPKLKKFAAAKQRQLDELLDKNSEGTITPAEKARLERLVSEAERLTVENTKRLAAFSQTETAAAARRGRARDRLGFTAAHGTLNDGAGRNVPAARHGAGHGACEYCRLLELATGVTFHVQHFVPRFHGGNTMMSNLLFARRLQAQAGLIA